MTASSSRLAACRNIPTFRILLSSEAALAGDVSEPATSVTNPKKRLRIAPPHLSAWSIRPLPLHVLLLRDLRGRLLGAAGDAYGVTVGQAVERRPHDAVFG